MFNLGPFELVVIFVVALLVFGPDKLPEMGRQIGKAVREFRKFQESMQGQVRDVLEPIAGPIVPNGSIVGPQPTNIRGTIPTDVPPGPNVPRSATIQNPEAPDGEDTPPPGTFGHYAPVESATTASESAAPAPGNGSPASAGEASAPTTPADPESR